ncbi:hypothetical protein ACIFQM_00445 [Paenibacillus sp. NRS-1782]|uniref:hypothetical protein n=1 Tax=unclassified Paenibacillus TaxID=185978 RepID=UPI003D27E10B
MLERLGVWEQLTVVPVSDPLMLAVNPSIGFDSKNFIILVISTLEGITVKSSACHLKLLIFYCHEKCTG